ncbi:hypothetical protein HMPREF1139_1350 [Campylobacter sp. FOBRC14]|nr:hypothetical protein HMPREF1139_1350 [Campylobacter sp. FOBRC14]
MSFSKNVTILFCCIKILFILMCRKVTLESGIIKFRFQSKTK